MYHVGTVGKVAISANSSGDIFISDGVTVLRITPLVEGGFRLTSSDSEFVPTDVHDVPGFHIVRKTRNTHGTR